jgi:Cft2 family RNA processing exonuclease
MRLVEEMGIKVGNGSPIHIDCSCAGSDILISHAHSDHAKLRSGQSYIMTPATKDLISSNSPKSAKIKTADFGKKIKLDSAEIFLRNSGHMLGSAQIEINDSVKTIAVSSDFKMQDSLVTTAAQPLKGDVLLIETTFGIPQFVFPPREKVYEEMARWSIENIQKGNYIVLAGYAIGKAQELTKFATDLLGETPIVHEKIFDNNRVYESHGVKFGEYLKLEHNLKDANILIMPPSLVNPHIFQAIGNATGKKVVSAIATGWNYQAGFTKSFPLSDHADFNQLVQYVKESKPKLVLTNHGYSHEFAGYVQRRIGIPARELSSKGQKTLAEFGEC